MYVKADFKYEPDRDVDICPTADALTYRYTREEDGLLVKRYWTKECQICPVKSRCALSGGATTTPVLVGVKLSRRITGSTLGVQMSGRGGKRAAARHQTACPAAQPEDHAHWKLYPPSQPVTSTTSPMKCSPGTPRASKLRASSARVSTPPSVTSAVR